MTNCMICKKVIYVSRENDIIGVMVFQNVRKDLNSIGLDPSISFLHELSNSRASLVYDVQKLYRWLVDLSVISFISAR